MPDKILPKYCTHHATLADPPEGTPNLQRVAQAEAANVAALIALAKEGNDEAINQLLTIAISANSGFDDNAEPMRQAVDCLFTLHTQSDTPRDREIGDKVRSASFAFWQTLTWEEHDQVPSSILSIVEAHAIQHEHGHSELAAIEAAMIARLRTEVREVRALLA